MGPLWSKLQGRSLALGKSCVQSHAMPELGRVSFREIREASAGNRFLGQNTWPNTVAKPTASFAQAG